MAASCWSGEDERRRRRVKIRCVCLYEGTRSRRRLERSRGKQGDKIMGSGGETLKEVLIITNTCLRDEISAANGSQAHAISGNEKWVQVGAGRLCERQRQRRGFRV